MKTLKLSNGYSSKEYPKFLFLISPAFPITRNMQLCIQAGIEISLNSLFFTDELDISHVVQVSPYI